LCGMVSVASARRRPRSLELGPRRLTVGRRRAPVVSSAAEIGRRGAARGRGTSAARAPRRPPLVDVAHRIDGLAVAQHLEVQVRAGRAARVAQPGDDLPALHGVAHRDQVRRVVRVARDVAVAVIDLDELAVAVPGAGPDDDARRDSHDLAAGAAGEVDALVERAAAGERVRSLTEARGDVSGGDRAADRPDLVRELAVEQEILEHIELARAVPELLRQAVQRAQDAAQIELVGVREELLGPAERGRRREVEFAVVEAGHLRQPRPERIEPHDVRVHLAEAQRERVDALLEAAAGLLEQRLLRLELRTPGFDLRARVRDAESVCGAPADIKRGAEEAEGKGAGGDPEPPRGKLQLGDVTAVSVEEDQFHPARPPLDVCVLLFRNRAQGARVGRGPTAESEAFLLLVTIRQPRYRRKYSVRSVALRPALSDGLP